MASKPEMGGHAGFRSYVVGNAGAVLVGLFVAYFALTLSHTIDASVINIKTVDLMEYYSAARLILAGHAGLMYDWGAMGHLQTALVGPTPVTFGTLINLYPPFFVTMFLPLAALPYNAAYVGWLIVNCILLMGALYALEQYAGLAARQATAFRWISLTFLPVFMALGDGQASAYLLALTALSFLALRSERFALAGAALAAASIKPAYVAPILLVFLIRRHWRVLFSYAASVALLLAAPLPIFGPSIYRSYVQLLMQDSSWQGRSTHWPLWYHHVPVAPATYGAQWNDSLAGFAERLLPNPGSAIVYAALSLVVLAILTACTLRCRSIDIPFGMAVVAGLLVSPHTLAYDLTLLLLPVAVVLRYRHAIPHVLGWALPVTLVSAYAAISAGYVLAFFLPVQFPVLGAAALLAWMWLLAYRVPSDATQQLAVVGVRRADSSMPMVGFDTA